MKLVSFQYFSQCAPPAPSGQVQESREETAQLTRCNILCSEPSQELRLPAAAAVIQTLGFQDNKQPMKYESSKMIHTIKVILKRLSGTVSTVSVISGPNIFCSQIREQMSGPDLHVFTLKFLALKKMFFPIKNTFQKNFDFC